MILKPQRAVGAHTPEGLRGAARPRSAGGRSGADPLGGSHPTGPAAATRPSVLRLAVYAREEKTRVPTRPEHARSLQASANNPDAPCLEHDAATARNKAPSPPRHGRFPGGTHRGKKPGPTGAQRAAPSARHAHCGGSERVRGGGGCGCDRCGGGGGPGGAGGGAAAPCPHRGDGARSWHV